ncbi:transposase [Streptomyces adelaidensis]|uniref:transposase n=1 Tax=Streptomyces adelaidensis TaxID=2796465 RepID=UPI001908645F|nr:transposase [Streptomyces adelaidensis]
MPAPRKYPPELIERGVRMVIEMRPDAPGRSSIVRQVGELLDIHPEVLRHWVNKADKEAGQNPNAVATVTARVRQLEKENADLRRLNGILKAAAVLFAAELESGQVT